MVRGRAGHFGDMSDLTVTFARLTGICKNYSLWQRAFISHAPGISGSASPVGCCCSFFGGRIWLAAVQHSVELGQLLELRYSRKCNCGGGAFHSFGGGGGFHGGGVVHSAAKNTKAKRTNIPVSEYGTVRQSAVPFRRRSGTAGDGPSDHYRFPPPLRETEVHSCTNSPASKRNPALSV